MLITADASIALQVQSLRDHGASKSDLVRHMGSHSYLLPDFNMVGYNYRLTDLQGALGVVQMGRLGWILEQRTRLAHRYDAILSELSWLRLPVLPPDCRHGYQSYVCLFQAEPPTLQNVEVLHTQRNALMDALEVVGIATRPGTHAVHMLGFYRQKYGLKPEDFPNAYLADRLTFALPLYAQLTDSEQDCVMTHLAAHTLQG
jgi:dTDP-4-amino-4,6-dideoxygalactose transaminase